MFVPSSWSPVLHACRHEITPPPPRRSLTGRYTLWVRPRPGSDPYAPETEAVWLPEGVRPDENG